MDASTQELIDAIQTLSQANEATTATLRELRGALTEVKVWSDEEVCWLRAGFWAVMLEGPIATVTHYLRFDRESDRDQWVKQHSQRLPWSKESVPLSVLLDTERWQEKKVNLSAKRQAIVQVLPR